MSKTSSPDPDAFAAGQFLAQLIRNTCRTFAPKSGQPDRTTIDALIVMTAEQLGVLPAQPAVIDHSHPGFLVWNPNGPYPPRYQHVSHEGARQEALRMAGIHIGDKFYVMMPVEVAIAERKIMPTEIRLVGNSPFASDDEIPF
ncbi:hypothetical protein [Asticcacaulis solisilvae]|uniref:hypothetical protein n=1 Tax=Asticcacaulis solisilvae TaxID=1217274 RepID=UPI003FD8E048